MVLNIITCTLPTMSGISLSVVSQIVVSESECYYDDDTGEELCNHENV